MAQKNLLLLIRIPPGKNEENTFEQFLVNLHEALKDERISLEIVSRHQHIYFYLRINPAIRELIEGQLYALYPDAEIFEDKDYINPSILNDKKRSISAASLSLTRTDIYPIKTHPEFDSDSLAGIFSVLTKATEDDEIWIQTSIRPRPDNWKLNFGRSWKMKTIGFRNILRIKDYFKIKSKQKIKEQDREVFNKKANKRVFFTNIHIAYIAKNKELSNQKLGALSKAFSQFNTIDFNEFKVNRITNLKNFIQKYQQRQFNKKPMTLSVEEIASVHHYPDPDTVPHIVHVMARKAEPPRDLPREETVKAEDISYFGISNFHNQNIRFGIKRNDRRRHLYVVGKSGTGKSKMLELLIMADIMAGHGVGVLDPHGDLADTIIKYIPKERIDDVVYFNPADADFPISFNPLEQVPPEMRVRVTIGFIDIFKRLFGSNWTPRLEHVLRYTTLALLDSPNTTVLSILKMLSDKNYRQKIVANIQDSVIKNFWVNEFAAWSEKFDNEAIMPILNKVGQFVSTSLIRNIVGQPQNKIDFRKIMDEGKILIMRISKGNLGEENAALIGAMVVTKIQQAAMGRTEIPEEQRRDFYLYCDEFQYFATDTFAEILSEARKYHLNLTMAHQYMGQLNDKIRTTTFGNVGTIINFRVGAEDSVILEKEYTPIFEIRDIINLGVREFYIKMSVDGEMRDAFSGYTLTVPKPGEDHTEAIIASSRKKYTKPRQEVEEILKSWDEGGSEEGPGETEENFEEPIV